MSGQTWTRLYCFPKYVLKFMNSCSEKILISFVKINNVLSETKIFFSSEFIFPNNFYPSSDRSEYSSWNLFQNFRKVVTENRLRTRKPYEAQKSPSRNSLHPTRNPGFSKLSLPKRYPRRRHYVNSSKTKAYALSAVPAAHKGSPLAARAAASTRRRELFRLGAAGLTSSRKEPHKYPDFGSGKWTS